MNQKEEEFYKRYDQFKNNNLPTPFFDEERQSFEYVYFNGDTYHDLYACNTITYALDEIVKTSLYYPFIARTVTGHEETTVKKCHAHFFDDVVKYLYYSPESFDIAKEEEKFYSKQELAYLKQIKNYLLLIGLKDVECEEMPESRYKNKKHDIYKNAVNYHFSDMELANIKNGKQNFQVYPGIYSDGENKVFEPNEYQALFLDNNEEFHFFVEFTERKVKTYKEIKDFYQNEELKDTDKVTLNYFKIIEDFK